MARPFKKPEDRKNYHLRVPLTDSQRQTIESACNALGEDMAKWSRDVLLDAAKRVLKKSGK